MTRTSRRATRRRILNEACIAVARDQVYPELVDVRRAIDTRFGRDAGRGLHRIEGSTRRKPRRLYPQLEGLVVALRDNEKLPPPLRPGPAGERRKWLRQLEPGYQKLTEMLQDLDDHEIVEVALRNDRDFELESFDVVYGQALDFVRSVLRLSGCDERVVWHLLPTVQQRRLKAKARKESEARAEGRR